MSRQGRAWQLRRLTDGALGAVLGGLFYGAWAVWANGDAGAREALCIGSVHWLTSAGLTYFGTAAMRGCFGLARQPNLGALLAFAGGLTLTYGVLLLVHESMGTPHILLTLAAGVLPNLLFCSGYALLLQRTATPTTDGPALTAASP